VRKCLDDVLPPVAAADAEPDGPVDDQVWREAGAPRLVLGEDAQLVAAGRPDHGHRPQLLDALEHRGVVAVEQVHRPQLEPVSAHAELPGQERHLHVEEAAVEDIEGQVQLGAEAQRAQPSDAGDDDLVERAFVDLHVDLRALHLGAHRGQVVARVAQESRQLGGHLARCLLGRAGPIGQLQHRAVDELVEELGAAEAEQLLGRSRRRRGVGAGQDRRADRTFALRGGGDGGENEGGAQVHPAKLEDEERSLQGSSFARQTVSRLG